jgi:hypothetical protein
MTFRYRSKIHLCNVTTSGSTNICLAVNTGSFFRSCIWPKTNGSLFKSRIWILNLHNLVHYCAVWSEKKSAFSTFLHKSNKRLLDLSCPPFYPHVSVRLPLESFPWNLVLGTVKIIRRETQICLKSYKNIEHFTWRPQSLLLFPSSSSSGSTVLGQRQPLPKSSSTRLDLVTHVSSSSRPHSSDLPQLTQATSA